MEHKSLHLSQCCVPVTLPHSPQFYDSIILAPLHRASICLLWTISRPKVSDSSCVEYFATKILLEHAATSMHIMWGASNLRMWKYWDQYKIRKWCPICSAVNSFIDQGEFEAMKTLSDRRVPRCDKYQFCAKMKVSMYLNCFQDIIVEHCGLNKKEWENWHFCYRTLFNLAVFREAFRQLLESKGTLRVRVLK